MEKGAAQNLKNCAEDILVLQSQQLLLQRGRSDSKIYAHLILMLK